MNNMQEEVIALAEKLIACPSITPNDAGCQDIIKALLTAQQFTCETLVFEGVTNLWARKGTASPLVVFAGHTDVVPPGPEAEWSSPPFQPTVRDGFLYGRGATDMKANLASMVIAAKTFVQEHPHFKGSLGFLITSDEEGPSLYGTKEVMTLLTQRGVQIDYCVVGEASSHARVGDQVRIGRRGSLSGHLTIHGKQGHVAFPELAKNPIHLSAIAIHELASTEWDKGNAEFPPTTLQISNIHAGTGANNVIPGHLDVTFNFRFSNAVTSEELQARTKAILDKHHLNYHLTWHQGANPFLTKHGRLLTATQTAIRDITQQEVTLSTGGGTSDARFIAPTGAEVIELGVPHATAHQINEHVALTDLGVLTKIYLRILELML